MDEMALPGLPLSSHHGVDTTRILIFILVVALLALFGAILAVIMETSLIWAAVSYTGIGFVIAIWFRPYWGLLFLLFVIPLQYLANITGDGSITLAKIVMSLVVVVWTARNVILRDENAVRAFFSHPILIVCWLYLLSTLPSFVNARDFTSAFLFLTTKLLAYVVLASIIADMVRTRDRLASLCKTVLSISLIVVGIFGSYELASGNSILSFFGLDYHLISGSSEGILATTKTDVLSVDREAEWFRVASTYLDPDLFCVFVILSLGYAMGLWHLTVSGFWRAIIVIYFPLAHAMLIATGSRSGFLAIFAFWIMVLFMFRVRFRIALITFSCAGILCLIPFLHELFPAYRSGISMDAFHSDARYGFWKTGINMIRDKPLIGIGLANFTAEYFDYSSPSAIKGKAYMAHNIFLQVLSETGLIGLVFFLALIFSVLTTLWRMIRDSKDAEIVNLSKCLFVSGVSCVPLALTHNVLDLAYLWITLGVIVAVCNLDSGASADSKHNEMSGVLC